ncbi:MAG: hypothetical protein K0M50_03265 [Prolixibacteraceae bacterium]|nr:hypothetical protein [Prolixibacteraceae bacterium]
MFNQKKSWRLQNLPLKLICRKFDFCRMGVAGQVKIVLQFIFLPIPAKRTAFVTVIAKFLPIPAMRLKNKWIFDSVPNLKNRLPIARAALFGEPKNK